MNQTSCRLPVLIDEGATICPDGTSVANLFFNPGRDLPLLATDEIANC
jgi:hypothetical protein